MAGKSGRSINNVPESSVKRMIFSWEGILVLIFIAVNIFCAMFSEFYNISSLLRQMPVYLAEVFLMLPMAYILVLGEIDISVGSIVCLSATMCCIVCNMNAPFIVVVLTGLAVGTVCGAINGLILTKFTELPPMIVTLATQIIFRGIAEIILGSGGSITMSSICHRNKPSDRILFRYSCSEDPNDHLYSDGNGFRPLRYFSFVLILRSQYHNRKRF